MWMRRNPDCAGLTELRCEALAPLGYGCGHRCAGEQHGEQRSPLSVDGVVCDCRLCKDKQAVMQMKRCGSLDAPSRSRCLWGRWFALSSAAMCSLASASSIES